MDWKLITKRERTAGAKDADLETLRKWRIEIFGRIIFSKWNLSIDCAVQRSCGQEKKMVGIPPSRQEVARKRSLSLSFTCETSSL